MPNPEAKFPLVAKKRVEVCPDDVAPNAHIQ
jgi:hypothetical protein